MIYCALTALLFLAYVFVRFFSFLCNGANELHCLFVTLFFLEIRMNDKRIQYLFTSAFFSVSSVLFGSAAFATPVSTFSKITSIRQVDTSMYISTESSTPCSTTVYWLEGTYPGAGMIANTALLALATGKSVQLEIRTDTGCTGWGSKIMGVEISN
ncbi:hypothetical protein CCP4SC76_5710002 [Gammaproteobacteria bacterium]